MFQFDFPAAFKALSEGAVPSELEGQHLEFKQEEDDLRRTLEGLADAVVCLANAAGGTLVVGVRDTPDAFGEFLAGVSSRLTTDIVRKGIFERTRPSLSIPIAEFVDRGRRIMIITVPQGVVFYSNAKGTATRRLGPECVPFPPEQQRQAAAARGQLDWSAEPLDADQTSLGDGEVQRLRRLLGVAGREDMARADDRKLLRDLRLLVPNGRITRAGLLLLGAESELRRLLPTYGYAYQYRATPGGEATARLRGARPVLAAVDLLLEAVAVRSFVRPISAAAGVQLQIHDYPQDAVRELLVNGLVHRDFELEGSVEIEQSPEWLTISSPGGLVFGVTPQNILTHPSTPRNRLLLETVTTLQVAERTGQGIDRTYRVLLQAGKSPPTITDDGTEVRALVQGGTGNDAFARFVAELDSTMAGDVDALLALHRLREQRTVGASDLALTAQRSAVEAQLSLEHLADTGMIEPTRRTARRPFPTYVLTAEAIAELGRAVKYHSRRADETDRKVVEHVREYGHVTNQTLRRLFNLDLFAARNLLRDLQDRGILSKIDPGRGGRGIRYGAGPQFPDPGTSRLRTSSRQGRDLELGL